MDQRERFEACLRDLGDTSQATLDWAWPIWQATEAAAQWQLIETAPKTGRTLLLGYPNVLGKWRTTRGQWMSEAYIEQNWEEPDDAEPGWYETSVEAEDVPSCWPITPTHWMPLPAAPVERGGEKS